jgi:DNA topoisomerase-3
MVLLVGDALKALEEYKEVPYYENRFKDENGIVYNNKEEPRFASEKEVPHTYQASEVIKDGEVLKHTIPPRLLDLAALSSMLAPRGYRAKEILSSYQKMYDAQIVSYPRTEDRFISREQFNELLPKAGQIATLVGVDPGLLTHQRPRASHVKSGGSHGANRPGSNVPSSLASLKKYGRSAPAIYETLAKNYLVMLAEDYTYHQQKGHLKDYPSFTGTANVPVSAGWKAVFHYDEDKEENTSKKGLGTRAEPFIYKGTNKKPPVPTMKWLMKQLEKHDVGTGATRTSIYADVTNEKTRYPLLKETKGKLSMTIYGNMSYQLLPKTHIGTLKITEQLQKQMREVSEGKAKPDECLKEIRQMIIDDKAVMEQNSAHLVKETVTLEKDGSVRHESAPQKEKYEGEWNGKAVSFSRVWAGHRFTDEECAQLLNGGEIILKGLKGRRKSTYSVKGKLAEQTYKGKKFVGFERTEYVNDEEPQEKSVSVSGKVTDFICPYCGKKIVLKNGRYGDYYDCPSGDLRIPAKYGGHTFSEEELKTLLDLKETDYLPMKSKAGRPFEASAKLNQGKVTLNFRDKKTGRKTYRRRKG